MEDRPGKHGIISENRDETSPCLPSSYVANLSLPINISIVQDQSPSDIKTFFKLIHLNTYKNAGILHAMLQEAF